MVTRAALRGSGLLLTQGLQVLLGNRCLLRPVVGRLERRIAAEDAVEGDEVRRLGQFGGDQRAPRVVERSLRVEALQEAVDPAAIARVGDRKRTRLNSSH